ncbi:DUF2934 domain-containing protein (plasmid) [Rhizobium sp. WW22]|uniref:DUF2934 domain-containing protein n=1 Tax=Rhizobium sp. WW22 TaxID=3389070 RepID=UPI000DDA3F05
MRLQERGETSTAGNEEQNDEKRRERAYRIWEEEGRPERAAISTTGNGRNRTDHDP